MKQIRAGVKEEWEALTKGVIRRAEESKGCLQVHWDKEPGGKDTLITMHSV